MTLTDAVKREEKDYVESILQRPGVDVDECVCCARPCPACRPRASACACTHAPCTHGRASVACRHDATGKTALMHAAERGLKDVVAILLENSADVQLQDAVRTRTLLQR